MKISIIQGAFLPVPPLLGGAVEKMWFRLAQDFVARGHEVRHFSRLYDSQASYESIQGVQHQRIHSYDQPKGLLLLKFMDFLYSYRVCKLVPTDSDVVITNSFWSPLLLSKILRQRAYIDIQRMPKGQCSLYQYSGRLRANSNPVADAIRKELKPSFYSKVKMIPNPLPFEPPLADPTPYKKNIILYAGRIHPEKGIELLIHAARAVPNDWRVDIIGPWEVSQGGAGNDYLTRLKLLARGLPVHIHEPEFDTERLSEYYREASIFAYPSLAEKGETFGLAPLEAMAWRCVPVVSDLACFKEFISSELNGLFFDHRQPDAASQFGFQLQKLTTNGTFRKQLAQEAKLVGVTHHPQTIADAFLSDFQSMLNEQG